MKRQATLFGLIFFATVFGIDSNLWGQIKPKNAGIGVRGTYWKMNSDQDHIVIRNSRYRSDYHVGSGGGWLYFFSRTGDYTFLEFSIGAVGKVTNEEEFVDGRETEVTAIVPIVLGMRYQLFDPRSGSALQPYLTFGGGPYWLSDILVFEDDYYDEEIRIKTKLHAGGYAGGGINFMLGSNLGLNFDLRYHFIDFNKNHDFSGFEYGLGLNIHWGTYRPQRRR